MKTKNKFDSCLMGHSPKKNISETERSHTFYLVMRLNVPLKIIRLGNFFTFRKIHAFMLGFGYKSPGEVIVDS